MNSLFTRNSIFVFAVCALAFIGRSPAAAQDICAGYFAPARVADRLLQQSESATAKGDRDDARAAYEAAMVKLEIAPWTISENRCDPQHYGFYRFTVAMRSLAVGLPFSKLDAIETGKIRDKMWRQFFDYDSSADPMAYSRIMDDFEGQDPALWKQTLTYDDMIDKAVRKGKIAMHSPVGSNCKFPNVDAEPLDVFFPEAPPDLSPGLTFAHVNVWLDADGKVTNAAVKDSGGSEGLARSALDAANHTTYLPSIKNCKPVASLYILDITGAASRPAP